jgi:hypothetical protein
VAIRGIGEVDGRVVWARSGRAGIAFDELVDPALALCAMPVGAGAHSISQALDGEASDDEPAGPDAGNPFANVTPLARGGRVPE